MIYLHLGVPKSGTSYLQEILWRNLDRLEELGYGLAAKNYREHFRAAVDLCERDTVPRAAGAWSRQVRRFTETPGNAIMSQEELVCATADQVKAALDSLRPAPVTAVITARDMARQVKSYWQQKVKSRFAGSLTDIVEIIKTRQDTDERFWAHQDLLAIADNWLTQLPAERVVVVTVPPKGAPPELLWRRFATACDLDPAGFDLEVDHPNESLGGAQVELLRRVNAALGDRLPIGAGYAVVRMYVGNELLAGQAEHVSYGLDADTHEWAAEQSRLWISGLEARGVRIVGDLAELEPAPWEPALDPSAVDEASINRSAVELLADMLAEWNERGQQTPRRDFGLGGARRRAT